jgi:hypothetical protein
MKEARSILPGVNGLHAGDVDQKRETTEKNERGEVYIAGR